MSYRVGIGAIHLRPTPRLAHTEYCRHDVPMRHMAAVAGLVHFSLALPNRWPVEIKLDVGMIGQQGHGHR